MALARSWGTGYIAIATGFRYGKSAIGSQDTARCPERGLSFRVLRLLLSAELDGCGNTSPFPTAPHRWDSPESEREREKIMSSKLPNGAIAPTPPLLPLTSHPLPIYDIADDLRRAHAGLMVALDTAGIPVPRTEQNRVWDLIERLSA